MFRFMMRLIILLMFILCTGIKADEINPLFRCVEALDIDEELKSSAMKLSPDERLNAVCPNIKSFFKCMSEMGRKRFGYDLKQIASLLEGTEIGKGVQLVVNLINIVEEICTEGSQLRTDILMDFQCFLNLSETEVMEHCENEAFSASAIYRRMSFDTYSSDTMFGGYSQTRQCVIAIYKLGCLGAKVFEECGQQAFNTYSGILKKTGFFKLKICSPYITYTLKTTVLNILEDLESRRSIYRMVFDLKKKRK